MSSYDDLLDEYEDEIAASDSSKDDDYYIPLSCVRFSVNAKFHRQNDLHKEVQDLINGINREVVFMGYNNSKRDYINSLENAEVFEIPFSNYGDDEWEKITTFLRKLRKNPAWLDCFDSFFFNFIGLNEQSFVIRPEDIAKRLKWCMVARGDIACFLKGNRNGYLDILSYNYVWDKERKKERDLIRCFLSLARLYCFNPNVELKQITNKFDATGYEAYATDFHTIKKIEKEEIFKGALSGNSFLHIFSCEEGQFIHTFVLPEIIISENQFKYLHKVEDNPACSTNDGLTKSAVKYSADGKVVEGFHQNIKKEELRIKDGVEEIAPETFKGCLDIRVLILPDSLERIGHHAFANCKNLQKVCWSYNLREIGERAFEQCSSLYTVDLQGTRLQEIGAWAFAESDLRNLYLPESFRCDSDIALADCMRLQLVRMWSTSYFPLLFVGSRHPYVIFEDVSRDMDGCLHYPGDYYTEDGCVLESILEDGDEIYDPVLSHLPRNGNIPEGVEYIDELAIDGNSNVVVVPDSVRGISRYAINGNKNVSFVIKSSTPGKKDLVVTGDAMLLAKVLKNK